MTIKVSVEGLRDPVVCASTMARAILVPVMNAEPKARFMPTYAVQARSRQAQPFLIIRGSNNHHMSSRRMPCLL